MKGKIIFYDVNRNSGIISGEDAVRYSFVKLDWKGTVEPREGLKVDFEIENDEAKDIFVVEHALTSIVEDTGLTKIMTVGDWFVTILITSIPIVNIIMLFIWAFGSDAPKSKVNWAKATLIWMAIGVALSLIFIPILTAIMVGISEALY